MPVTAARVDRAWRVALRALRGAATTVTVARSLALNLVHRVEDPAGTKLFMGARTVRGEEREEEVR
jgi:hypothetical protein